MTDSELLELAAKAAGLQISPVLKADRGMFGYRELCINGNACWPWNPLNDDGDALRLAVRLQMCVAVFDDEVIVGWRSSNRGSNVHEPIGGDACAAARRAIVRAAAEIGKTK